MIDKNSTSVDMSIENMEKISRKDFCERLDEIISIAVYRHRFLQQYSADANGTPDDEQPP